MLSEAATTPGVNEWMADAVVVHEDGSVSAGKYDGYGSVGNEPDAIVGSAWHLACWEVEEKPSEFRGESAFADDQGWFFDPGVHDLADPRGPAVPLDGQIPVP